MNTFRKITDPMIPAMIPIAVRSVASLRMTEMIYVFDAPSDFKIPISRVRSVMVVYIERKMTRKPIPTASPIITEINTFSAGNIIRSHQIHIFVHRQNRIVRQQCLDGFGGLLGITGVRALDEERRRFVLCTHQILERGQRNKPAGEFAVFHDSADAEIMVQQLDGLTHFGVMGTGINVVHQDVVGRLKRAARVINETARNGLETGHVNATNEVQRLYGVDVNQGGRHRQHVRQFC